jgi:hypothetical protein
MASNEPDIFLYKMVADNGGAPCIWGGVLSLALCKPKIRKSAEPGALVFGFGCKKYKERLIYVARITGKTRGKTYYAEPDFVRRPDCIYREDNGTAIRKPSAKYHAGSDQRRKDVGLHFENAFVLLSDDFRYFGRRGPVDYKEQFPMIGQRIEALKQGHRRYHSKALREELMQLKTKLWARNRQMKLGAPHDRDRTGTCNRETGSARC